MQQKMTSRSIEGINTVPGYNTLEFYILDTLKNKNIAYHQSVFLHKTKEPQNSLILQ